MAFDETEFDEVVTLTGVPRLDNEYDAVNLEDDDEGTDVLTVLREYRGKQVTVAIGVKY